MKDPTPGISENRPSYRKKRKKLPLITVKPKSSKPTYSVSPAAPTSDFLSGKKKTRYKRMG